MTARAPVAIDGLCDARFAGLREAFAHAFARGEEGAALAVYLDGKPVVDLWGGLAEPATGRPWQRDTLCAAFSISKAFVAAMAHMLADRGLLDLDAPVARYWPEFAAAGKGDVRVSDLLDHRAALTYVDADLAPGDLYDWPTMTRALAESRRHAPFGAAPTYLNLTFGYLVGEVVRRIDGRTIAPFLREEIAGPLGVDFHFALSDAEIARCARIAAEAPPSGKSPPPVPDPAALARSMQGMIDSEERFNLEIFRRSEIGAGSGHGTARGIARFFACLGAGGSLDGVSLMSEATRDRAIGFRCAGTDPIVGLHNRFALGFQLNDPPGAPMGPNPRAFGHLGAGGRIGFADPDAGLAFAYLPVLRWWGGGLGPRGTRLVEAAFACL